MKCPSIKIYERHTLHYPDRAASVDRIRRRQKILLRLPCDFSSDLITAIEMHLFLSLTMPSRTSGSADYDTLQESSERFEQLVSRAIS